MMITLLGEQRQDGSFSEESERRRVISRVSDSPSLHDQQATYLCVPRLRLENVRYPGENFGDLLHGVVGSCILSQQRCWRRSHNVV